MRIFIKSLLIALRIWFYTSLALTAISLFFFLFMMPGEWYGFVVVFIVSSAASIPVLVLLSVSIYALNRFNFSIERKLILILLGCLLPCFMYGILVALTGAEFFADQDQLAATFIYSGLLCACALCAWFLNWKRLHNHFSETTSAVNFFQQHNMETAQPSAQTSVTKNNVFIKAIVTACLILVLMIPTLLISNLVSERKNRNISVVNEVSNMWASSQTIAGPFIFIPFQVLEKEADGKVYRRMNHIWLMPEDLQLKGDVKHLIRQKGIYKVMLYRADLKSSGTIKIQLPKEVPEADVIWEDAKICYGISDFKGIEEKLVVKAGTQLLELSPGLPSDDLIKEGLSAPISITPDSLNQSIAFSVPLKLKGSEKLHFIPLSGNSSFTLSSDWKNPSFDGNNLPAERKISDSGFIADWSFNKANLPFNTSLSKVGFEPEKLAFGVTLLQPTDQYVKTDRSVKYAILFIGLTFALFFVIELLQKKPMHPVQYTLIGLALVIFYTLLLSISELIEFDTAYIIAAAATITLVTWYSGLHFRKWLPAAVLFMALVMLYGFIFVLIRLEDTALLFGSIGLFVILAVAMYFSRRVNWYGNEETRLAGPSVI